MNHAYSYCMTYLKKDRMSLRSNCAKVGLYRRAGIPLAQFAALAAVLLISGCASVRYDAPRVPSYAFDQPLQTTLGQEYWPQLASKPDQSGFHLLISGQDAFAARAALAGSAQRTLDLQYYIVSQDITTTVLLYEVLQAAQRGVRVRLLVDDLNVGDRESDLAMLARHPNIEVRLFNPFAERGKFGVGRALELMTDIDRLNRRMHNKLWIADGAVAVAGGRNLGDAYFNASSDDDFGDLDVLAAGPIVGEVSHNFDQFWNSEWAVPIAAIVGPAPQGADRGVSSAEMAARVQGFRDSGYVRTLRENAFGRLVRAGTVPLAVGQAQALYDAPGDPNTDTVETKGPIFPVLREVTVQAKKEIDIITPYLVPGPNGVALLCGAAGHGVRVRILTNSLVSTDVPVVHAGYARYRPQLLACGVELYELRPKDGPVKHMRPGLSSGAKLHTKTMVVDGQIAFIGSMNLDPRSKDLNTEVALRIDSPALGAQLTKLFNESTTLDQAFRVELDQPGNAKAALHWDTVEDHQPVRYDHEPLASPWLRLEVNLLGSLVPEGEL